MNELAKALPEALQVSLNDVQQAGAICFRRTLDGKLELLLVASRRDGRWGLPKGHIDPGEDARTAAQREAFEEAGVTGLMSSDAFGFVTYNKNASPSRYRVAVYVLEVQSISARFLEQGRRKTRWVSLENALDAVDRPSLKPLILRFRYLAGKLPIQ